MAPTTRPPTGGARIGTTIAESTPAFTPLPKPAPDAPNVVLIVLDDTGFAQLGCFGSDIDTPNIDALARDGVRLNNFHVTALCSPTRACLLTGRNHHAVGMGFLTDIPIGFPGYTGRIPRSAATLPRLLKDAGYSTYAVGKWHLAPRWEQSASGPFDLWPLGLGFERHYGFLAGDANQWTPELVCDNHFVDPPRRPEDGYHLTEDLADTAIRMIQDQHQATPDKPFFLYFATGAMHAPHQAPKEWIDAYRGRFDEGWDAWRERLFERQMELGVVPEGTTLTERPPWVEAWDDLSADQRRVYARMMEVFAGFLSHTDAQIGRVLDHLRAEGLLDDTLVLVLSDNGTSAEGGPNGSLNEHRFTHDLTDDIAELVDHIDELGGPRAYNHYAWGWAWAGNTPFRLWKRYAWLGGVRTPLIAHWPARFGGPAGQGQVGGAVRHQFAHAVDIFATVLDAAGVAVPPTVDGVTQQPVDGASLLPALDDASTPSPRDTQYFEMLGSRSIYHDGWKATTDHVGNQLSVERRLVTGSHDFDDDHWALFHLDGDFSEADDVGEAHPDRLRHLRDLWWAEAGRNQVLPLDDSLVGKAVAIEPAPWGPAGRRRFRPGGGAVAEDLLPPLGGGFRIAADLDTGSDGSPAGIICALGDWNNGFAVYLVDGRPHLCINLFGHPHRVAGPSAVGPGTHRLVVDYERRPPAGGRLRLFVDGDEVGDGTLPHDLPFRWQIGGAGLRIGEDAGFPVCDDYRPPFAFTGTLHAVELASSMLAPRDLEADLAAELRHE